MEERKAGSIAERLVQEAYEAQKKAYAPYSGFVVGAALLTKGGKIYRGCNIENAAYTPTNCAERTAFFKAVSHGEREFEAIAIVGNQKDEQAEAGNFCAPCGVCRQVMIEFCDQESFHIYVTDGQEIKSYLLKDLLPCSFGPKDLEKGES